MSNVEAQIPIATDAKAVLLINGKSAFGKRVAYDQEGQPPVVSVLEGEAEAELIPGLFPHPETGEEICNKVEIKGSLIPGRTGTVQISADGVQGEEESAQPITYSITVFATAPAAEGADVLSFSFEARD